MKIFLRDYHKEVIDGIAGRALTRWERALTGRGLVFDTAIPVHGETYFGADDIDAVRSEDSLVILHQQSSRGLWEKGYQDGVFKGHLVIVSTQGGAGLGAANHPRIHICHWRPEDFADNRNTRIAEFVTGLRSGNPDFTLLAPSADEHLWSLHLLCEAWLLSRWTEIEVEAKAIDGLVDALWGGNVDEKRRTEVLAQFGAILEGGSEGEFNIALTKMLGRAPELASVAKRYLEIHHAFVGPV